MKKPVFWGAFSAVFLVASCAAVPVQIVAKSSATPLHRADRLLSPAPHNYRHVAAIEGKPVRRGARSERFELRNGDCSGNDCRNPRSRAEIQIKKELGDRDIGKNIWYGWSFYNQSVPSFRRDNSLRLVFGQWTKGGAGQPIMRFIQLGKGEGNFDGCDPAVCDTMHNTTGDLVVQLKDIATEKQWGRAENDGYVCRILDMQKAKGRWVDLLVNTNFSDTNDGYLHIWVDGKKVCDYSGPMISAASLRNPEKIKHRRGIYASWTKRWEKAEKGAPHPNLVVYYDEFRSGTRSIDVDVSHAQAQARAPLD